MVKFCETRRTLLLKRSQTTAAKIREHQSDLHVVLQRDALAKYSDEVALSKEIESLRVSYAVMVLISTEATCE